MADHFLLPSRGKRTCTPELSLRARGKWGGRRGGQQRKDRHEGVRPHRRQCAAPRVVRGPRSVSVSSLFNPLGGFLTQAAPIAPHPTPAPLMFISCAASTVGRHCHRSLPPPPPVPPPWTRTPSPMSFRHVAKALKKMDDIPFTRGFKSATLPPHLPKVPGFKHIQYWRCKVVRIPHFLQVALRYNEKLLKSLRTDPVDLILVQVFVGKNRCKCLGEAHRVVVILSCVHSSRPLYLTPLPSLRRSPATVAPRRH